MRYRSHLPQLDGGLFLTDGGIETTLVFHEGSTCPAFAAFPLLDDEDGTARCAATSTATRRSRASTALGFVLESPTWRANPRWAAEIGYDERAARPAEPKAIALMEEIRDATTRTTTRRS